MTALPEHCCADALEAHLDATLFRALCDPSRLAIVARLATGAQPLNVSEASACCGVHISGTSRHLSMLKAAGIVTAARRGREVRYRLQTTRLVSLLRGLAESLEACDHATEEAEENDND